MSTLAVAPDVSPDLALAPKYPLPWRPMARVTWLQHRAALIGLLVVYAGCAIAIIVGEHGTHTIYARYVASGCVANPLRGPCGTIANALAVATDPFSALVIVLGALPAIIGTFVAAPLLAREYESGTFRFTWTQGVGRRRFVLTSVVMLAAATGVAGAVLGLLLGTWAHMFAVAGIESGWQSGLFDTTWATIGAWTLFAFAAGVFLGACLRRTVSSMAATMVGVGGLLVASFVVLVHKLLAIAPRATAHISPLGLGLGGLNQDAPLETAAVLRGSWLVRDWFSGPGGRTIGAAGANRIRTQLFGNVDTAKGVDPTSWLALHHDTFWVSYQPAGRLWIFQAAVAVVLVALAVLLGAATLRLVSRRS